MILSGVPHELILGPLLFNVFVTDSFQFIKKPDDNTTYIQLQQLDDIFMMILDVQESCNFLSLTAEQERDE